MRAQIAVADIEQRLELRESQLLANGQGAHDAEAHAFVDKAIESGILIAGGSRDCSEFGSLRRSLSLRAGARLCGHVPSVQSEIQTECAGRRNPRLT